MDLNKVLNQLIMERDLIDKAIASLERLPAGKPVPGRPRKTPVIHAQEKARAAGGFE